MSDDTDERTALLRGTSSDDNLISAQDYEVRNHNHPVTPDVITRATSGRSDGRPQLERKLSLADAAVRVELIWEDINVFVPEKKKGMFGGGTVVQHEKQILKDVSGIVRPGTLLAIIGASGAGKSTLMNVLNYRNRGNLIVSGDVRVNGEKIGRDITSISAYVQQDDLFIPTLKVKEHLWFQAQLRMDQSIPSAAKDRRVCEVMSELGLTKCADTIIGKPGGAKGISGGEMKRLGFASEVLTNPALLFCDEPTSGLDSYMAMTVVQTLKSMADKGKTVVCTIHQPSSEVFAVFDRLLIMAEGQVAYMGGAKDGLDFMRSIGYECPTNFNPADFYIYTLAVIPGKEAECKETVQTVCDAFRKSAYYDSISNEVEASKQGSTSSPMDTEIIIPRKQLYKASWWKQFKTVLWRCWICNAREPLVVRARIMQTVVIGLIVGLIYLQVPYDQPGVQDITGVLFLMQMQMTMGFIFSVVNTFPLEFPIYIREHHNGMYRVDVYYLSKVIAESPWYLILPVAFCSIVYWMVGLYADVESFLMNGAVMLLVANISISFGYFVSSSTSNPTLAMTIAPVIMLPVILFGGFFLNSASVPIYFIWLQYLSWFNYSNEVVNVYQWKKVTNITCNFKPSKSDLSSFITNFTTPFPPPTPTGKCFNTGQDVIDSLSFDEDRVIRDIIVMAGMIVGYRLLAFILLLIRSRRKS